MARRLLLGGAAAAVLLGVATATADAVYTSKVAGELRRHRSSQDPLFTRVRTEVVDASRALLSAVLLRAPPLCGERIRAAECGVARALGDGGASASDLRLLLALLAARDGRFDEALRLYGEAARDDPSDPRPKALGHALCVLTHRPVGALRWERGDDSRLAVEDAAQLYALVDELVVAAALGGAPDAIAIKDEEGGPLPESNLRVLRSAAARADAGLAAALRDEAMPAAKRLQLAALRAVLQLSVVSMLKTKVSSVVVKLAKPKSKPKEGEDSDKEAAA